MKLKQIAGCFLLILLLAEGRADINQAIKGDCNTEVNANGKVTVNINCENSKKFLDKPVEQWMFIEHYQVKGNLVKDMKTGLMWMRCSIGQNWDGKTCAGEALKLMWEQGMAISKTFDYAGFNDWRMPTKDELKSLVYCSNNLRSYYILSFFVISSACKGSYIEPTIIQSVFPNSPIFEFLSSSDYFIFSFLSTKDTYSIRYWAVDFKNGSEVWSRKFFDPHISVIRLVRGGQ